jgi:hypothetical protein
MKRSYLLALLAAVLLAACGQLPVMLDSLPERERSREIAVPADVAFQAAAEAFRQAGLPVATSDAEARTLVTETRGENEISGMIINRPAVRAVARVEALDGGRSRVVLLMSAMGSPQLPGEARSIYTLTLDRIERRALALAQQSS